MSSVEPLVEVQAAVVTRLRATAALTALVPAARILDAVPERETLPYLVYDAPVSIADRTFGQDGRELTFTVTAFLRDGSEAPGRTGAAGYRPGLLIADQVVAALAGEYPPAVGWVPITVAGYDVVDVDVLSVQATRSDDGITRQVDVTFGVKLERQAAA